MSRFLRDPVDFIRSSIGPKGPFTPSAERCGHARVQLQRTQAMRGNARMRAYRA